MADQLRFYLGTQSGLTVLRLRSGAIEPVGEYFKGRTVEAVVGRRDNPKVAFAGVAFDGGYRTRDGGQRWDKVIDGDVRAFAFDPNHQGIMYAGLGPVGLFRSEDGGNTWNELDGLLNMPGEVKAKWGTPPRFQDVEPAHVRNIFVHPDDANLIYVTLEHGGVVRSADRGGSWEDVTKGVDYPDMHFLSNYPGSKDRYYVSSARGFFGTADAAQGWKRVEDGMPWAYTEANSYCHDWLILPGSPNRPGNPTRLVLAGANGSPGFWNRDTRAEGVILVSDDDGARWREVLKGLPERSRQMAWALFQHPTEADTIFAGMGDGSRGFGFNPKENGTGAVYMSQDRGDTWEEIIPNIPSVFAAWVAVD